MSGERLEPLLSPDQIAVRVAEIAAEIDRDHPNSETPLWMVGALKGAVFFLSDLAQRVSRDVSIDFIQASSYGDSTESGGSVRILRDIDHDINGADVIVVEDIVDSGHTARTLLNMLRQRNPRSLRLAALLDKPTRRETDVTIDYLGFEIPNEFVVGYGLDFDERYRNLPGVHTIRFESGQ